MLTHAFRLSVYKEIYFSPGEDLHAAPSCGGRQKGKGAPKAEEVLTRGCGSDLLPP